MGDVKESCDDKIDMANSSGSKDLSKSLPVEAFNNFLQGKRSMLVQDFSFAVQSLADACEMYVEHFGELAIECAEVYLLYGKALFRLSQQQAGILGGALNDGSNTENSSENESRENESDKNENSDGDGEEGEENEANEAEGNEQEKEPSESTDSPPAVVDEGSSEAKAESTAETPEAKVEGEAETKAEENSEAKVESNTETKAESKSEEVPDCNEGAGPSNEAKSEDNQAAPEDEKMEGTEENTVEEDDLELAWNTLETAKSIFKRQDTVEAQLKVAEILQLLAEISMESDNNAAAISDLEECLKIQKKHLKPDDRILAESYYQMGLAQMLDKKYPEALDNFGTTKSILELRAENLRNTLKTVDDADGTFASADIKNEISDLETVLLDIKEKIDDTEELICNKKKELQESIDEPGSSSAFQEKDEKSIIINTITSTTTTTPTKPVSNITHLLKRKKPDEGASEDGVKRLKISINGETKVAPPETANAEDLKKC